MVAIDLANSSASRAFDLSIDRRRRPGHPPGRRRPAWLDEAVYTRLRVEGGIEQSAPVVTDYVVSPQLGHRPVQLLGVDPFAEAPFRSYLAGGNNPRRLPIAPAAHGRSDAPRRSIMGRAPGPARRSADVGGPGRASTACRSGSRLTSR